MPGAAKKQYQNTTVRVPKHVYQLAKNAISRSSESSFNEFVVKAIEEKVHRMTEAEIDSAFAQMAEDADYQRNSAAMAREFEKSDWETFRSTQDEHTSTPPVADSRPERKRSIGRMEGRIDARTTKARSR